MAKKMKDAAHQNDVKRTIKTIDPKTTAVVKIAPKPFLSAKPAVFTAALDTLAPFLDGHSIASLSKSRIIALVKKTGLHESDLVTLVGAHKLAAKTDLPNDVLFALGKQGVPFDTNAIGSTDVRELRKKIESAVKKNVIPPETLRNFNASRPTLARLQSRETRLQTLISTYKLKIPKLLVDRLEAKGFKTLADLRSAGNPGDLAKKLNLKPDDARLATLTAHANLSFLGSNVATNSVLIENGYTHLSGIARESDGMFVDKVGAVIGFDEALRIQSTAKAQTAVLSNYLSGLLTDRANGYELDSVSKRIADATDSLHPPKCECKDCDAAVSPLAYLADLIGYATTKLGMARPNVVPLFRLSRLNQPTGNHFYTQSAEERDLAVTRSGYQYDGVACYVFSNQVDQTSPLYRLYSPALADHFYTNDPIERGSLLNAGYTDEGRVGFIYNSSQGNASVSLFRLLNRKSRHHVYTIDPAERQQAINLAGFEEEIGRENAGHVPKEGYDRLTPHVLSQFFHQPFSDLPLACDQVDERVRQVRICIEVLRSYVSQPKVPGWTYHQKPELAFRNSEAEYRSQTYQALLLKLGTSFTELRAARGATAENRQALADRLGIPSGDQQRDYLDELLLDLDTASELDIERIFGLVDTNRDPLSRGAKLTDAKSQLQRWNFIGVSWGVNTDLDGKVTLSLSRSQGKTKLEAYRSSALTSTFLEGSGVVDPAVSFLPIVVLSPETDSNGRSNGLSGEFEVKMQPTVDTVTIQVIPQIVSWRLQKVRAQWGDQDWIKDGYSKFEKQKDPLPVIDPDVIGPDDFRDLAGMAFTKLWKPRREWLDGLIKNLTTIVFSVGATAPAVKAFSKLFDAMRRTAYGSTNEQNLWPSKAADHLRALQKSFSEKTDKENLEITIADLWDRFKLTPEMLSRLITLNNKYDGWVYDPTKSPPLESGEWEELYSLLAQAQKYAWYSVWVKEEGKLGLVFGPKDFWVSLREPKEGTWPPTELPKGVPFIDPETVKLDQLPDTTTGQEAIDLWTARQDALIGYNQNILSVKDRDLDGASARIRASLGAAIHDLEIVYELLLSQAPGQVVRGKTFVEQTLEWSVEAYMKVMGLRARLLPNLNPRPPKPSDAEWAEMERLLTTKYKERVLWKTWADLENLKHLAYWDMVKARLPRWRGSVEARQNWQRGLLTRSAAPLVDPDLLRETHFRQRRENPARDLWRTRTEKLIKPGGILESFRAGSKTRIGLENKIQDALGPFQTAGQISTLLSDALKNKVLMSRLDQLNLNRDALNFLARMHGLLAQTPPQKIRQEEWEAIAAILTQVWKSRQTAEWRLEEEQQALTLSPDWFTIPSFVSTTQFPPPRPPDPPTWRGARSDVVDWEDRLQSRLDQEQGVIDGVQQAVSAVEEMMLPLLRDALVISSHVPGTNLSEQADWITEHLLIDAKQSGCQKTSRVAQAIETVQQLLWSVRTSLLADAYPELKLLPVQMRDDLALQEFDEAWTFIGSYPMWRAAMFVLLYPENILLPSLKGHQSPAFRKLVDDLRGLNRIVPNRFMSAIKRYYENFNDICALNVEACFDTISSVWEESEGLELYASTSARFVSFLFARTPKGDLYWSVSDHSNPEWGQTYWRRLQGFKYAISNLVGCTVYKTPANRRLLYLFAKTNKDGDDKLEFLWLDLESGEWKSESDEVNQPEGARDQRSFTVVIQPTDESTVPSMFLTFQDSARFHVTLGEKGGRENGKGQELGAAERWIRNGVPANFGKVLYAPGQNNDPKRYLITGTSICIAIIKAKRKLFCYWFNSILYPSGGTADSQHVLLYVVSDIGNGDIAWTTDLPHTLPSRVTTAGQFPVFLTNVYPMGFAVCDLAGGNTPDLIMGYLKRNAQSQWEVHYQIGWNLDENGVPTSWGSETLSGLIFPENFLYGRVDNDKAGVDITQNGLRIAVATTPDGNNFLVAFVIGDPDPYTITMKVTKLANDGSVTGPIMTVLGPTPSMGNEGVPTGVGLAFASLQKKESLDVVVFYLMRPKAGGECVGEYFIGWNINLTTFIPEGGRWSTAQSVGGEDNWFGDLTTGGAIAVTDINNNTRKDLIVFHNRYENGKDLEGYYRIGFDMGVENVIPKTCNDDGIKPVSSSVSTGLYGLLPPHLIPGDFTSTKHSRNFVYLEEAYYFVPVLAALQLQKGGEYVAALDWLRQVYDYRLRDQQRSLMGLVLTPTGGIDYQRDKPDIQGDEYDWLLDPLNPHAIARTRRNAYLRFTLLSVIKCLLDYADAEFTQDTSESVPRARELYMTAFQLLYDNELKPVTETCEGVLQDLEVTFGEKWADYIPALIHADVKDNLGDFQHIKDGLQQVFDRYQNADKFLDKAREIVHKYTPTPQPLPRFGVALKQLSTKIPELYTVTVAERPLADLLEWTAMPDHTISSPNSSGLRTSPTMSTSYAMMRMPEGYGSRTAGNTSSHSGWIVISHLFCVPRNPVLRMLRLRANLNLYKIRTCRNISGLKRELEVYAAPTDTFTGMPSIGAGGQLVLPGTSRIQPSPYRYQALINRAKQLVQQAMQIEQAFLSTLEKSDAEAYAMLKAKQDMRLTMAGVTLQALRVTEAQAGVKLATLQRDRATIQIKTYAKWMSAGLSDLEKAIIVEYIVLSTAQSMAGAAEAGLQMMAAKDITGAAIGMSSTLIAARAMQATLDATIRISEIYASQERRMEEWGLQKELAEQDYAIGDQQIDLAEDHVRVAEQERSIARLQADNAQEGVDFLSGKFANKDLYDWMGGILERVYSFFLQQATGVAQLAQGQLAFERQEIPPTFIQSDYWDGPPDGNSTSATIATKAPDRRGLTGSARLLQDIYQLDQYAFDNDRRKLQLTKTISLAQLDPFGFQQFRETGILTFATAMELFDRDFPGHYLRLIKRVRSSVIALIPPTQGIRASLSSTGLSRVVIGGDIFQKINLRQHPETIALSSPINATGLFDLEAQSSSDMLLPFEGTGVDTSWEFRMLKASNPFDYDAIADVLLTIEYTALNSFDYQQLVIQSPTLTRPLSADRPFSFRSQFADAWYDLHNPAQTDDHMAVTFETVRTDFPANLSSLRIQHVVWYVASTTDKRIELEDVELRFTEQGGGTVGGLASTNEGIASTRRGNAGAWTSLIGKSPVGQWTMRLQNNAVVRQVFDQTQANPQKTTERVADILLVITYSGRTPEWPQ